jgi:hypothetical protein
MRIAARFDLRRVFRANGASPSRTAQGEPRRKFAIDLGLLALVGLAMAGLGPYRTLDIPDGLRITYWMVAVIGTGLIGIWVDTLIGRRIREFWPRVTAVAIVMTIPATPFIYALNAVLLDLPRRPWLIAELAWQVFLVALLLMALRALAWRRVVETRILVTPPLPEAEREFRLRLSAPRRSARLIALEAEDHYVRVHTDSGSELLTMRFSDALEELALAHGFRLHRSWWAAADAIEKVRWNRGSGEAHLAGGLVAPVSRSSAAALRQAGWR